MQTRKKDSAFPIFHDPDETDFISFGLSKRECFAAMALQGLIASDKYRLDTIAGLSVKMADDLIKALNEDQ